MKTLKELREKAVSQAQQKMMGMALAYKRGEMDDASPEVKKMADSMSMKDLEDFAKTKHKGLPVKKESVELEEAVDYFKVAKAFDDYAKKSGGIDKASFMKVGAFVRQLGKESDVNKQDKTFMAMQKFIGGMDTDPRDGVIQIFQKHGMWKDGRIMRESKAVKNHDIRQKNQAQQVKDKKVVDKHKFAYPKPVKEDLDEAMTLSDIRRKKEREERRKKDGREGETQAQRMQRKVYGNMMGGLKKGYGESTEVDEAMGPKPPKLKGNNGPYTRQQIEKAAKEAKVDLGAKSRMMMALRDMK